MEHENPSHNNSKNQSKTRFLKLTLSTLAAALGVQSKKNLEDDFSQSSPLPFIAAGIIFTAAFVLILALIVRVVLSSQT